MGPKGYRTLKDKLSQAGFAFEYKGHENGVGSALPKPTIIDPQIQKKREAAPFVKVTINSGNKDSTGILNALAPIVTMDPGSERALDGQDVPHDEPLLHPVVIGTQAVKFFDLHYPGSK